MVSLTSNGLSLIIHRENCVFEDLFATIFGLLMMLVKALLMMLMMMVIMMTLLVMMTMVIMMMVLEMYDLVQDNGALAQPRV